MQVKKVIFFRGILLSEHHMYWKKNLFKVYEFPRERNSRFCSHIRWQMFLLVSGRHVVSHPDVLQHGVSIQILLNFGKIFLWISGIRNFALTCSLRNIAVLLGVLLSGEAARKTKTFLLLPPQSPRSFSAPTLACLRAGPKPPCYAGNPNLHVKSFTYLPPFVSQIL